MQRTQLTPTCCVTSARHPTNSNLLPDNTLLQTSVRFRPAGMQAMKKMLVAIPAYDRTAWSHGRYVHTLQAEARQVTLHALTGQRTGTRRTATRSSKVTAGPQHVAHQGEVRHALALWPSQQRGVSTSNKRDCGKPAVRACCCCCCCGGGGMAGGGDALSGGG